MIFDTSFLDVDCIWDLALLTMIPQLFSIWIESLAYTVFLATKI